jgi:hypothetical protein
MVMAERGRPNVVDEPQTPSSTRSVNDHIASFAMALRCAQSVEEIAGVAFAAAVIVPAACGGFW